ELLRILDRGEPQGADDDPLVADAKPDLLRELVGVEERLEGRRQRIGVDDLTLAEGARGQRLDGSSSDRNRAVDAQFSRGDAAGLDVEADDVHWLFGL